MIGFIPGYNGLSFKEVRGDEVVFSLSGVYSSADSPEEKNDEQEVVLDRGKAAGLLEDLSDALDDD